MSVNEAIKHVKKRKSSVVSVEFNRDVDFVVLPATETETPITNETYRVTFEISRKDLT
ncbi:hypothetical protein [Salicibibacter halophilus]|uniref:hypothetical protein n=1 Tax=Salicibibacter halophilus TaxID=2502791 RepID=UPI00135BFC9C|nr:hypothetical protein [Salicibibacter halophilus]